jgi:hypothetical protein
LETLSAARLNQGQVLYLKPCHIADLGDYPTLERRVQQVAWIWPSIDSPVHISLASALLLGHFQQTIRA